MIAPTPQTRLRANFYIDGFNLYHGCFDDAHGSRASWRQFRWLNLATFCGTIFPRYEIQRIRYFTALVNPTPDNPDCRTRQLEYIRALETIPNLTVHRGRFATNVKRRRVADRTARRPAPALPARDEYVLEDEEKGSDVNLASYLLLDGFREEYDVAVVVSNDSDLVTPIELVRHELGRKVDLLNPRKKCAADLLGKAGSYRYVRVGVLSISQFPPTLTDANGTIRKPATW